MEKPVKVLKSHRHPSAEPVQVQHLTEADEFVWHPNDFTVWKKISLNGNVLRIQCVHGLSNDHQVINLFSLFNSIAMRQFIPGFFKANRLCV